MTPLHSAALLQQAIEHHQAGRFIEAEALYRDILQHEPGHGDALHLLGIMAGQVGRYEDARAFLEAASAGNPWVPEYYNSLGGVCQAMGDTEEAARLYLGAIELNADYLAPYQNLISLLPAAVEVRFNLGCVLHRQGQLPAAIEQYDAVLALVPDHAGAYNNRGGAYRELGRLDDALADFREALRVNPGFADAHNNLGLILHDKDLLAEAAEAFESALAARPDFAEAWCNLGKVLHARGRHEEAIEQYRQAIRLTSDSPRTLYNWACALDALRRYPEAIDKHVEALRLDPQYVEAHVNRALLLLLSGRYTEAWPEYEWRLSRPDWRATNSVYPETPRWDGSNLLGKTILLQAEQGFGDIIQFVRYLPLVKARCARVILEAPAVLHPLLAGVQGIDELVVPQPDNGKKADFAIHLLSLPGIFKTTPTSIPSCTPYLFAPEERLLKWRAAIPTGSFNVGFVWSGNPIHPENRERACGIEYFFQLAAVPGVRLFSLQKGEKAKEIQSAPPDLGVVDLAPELNDFADTAAVIMHLDLVISVDTAVVHLAGALGCPIWTLRYHHPYWVWGIDGPATPWYPTMRIFRHKSPGDWQGLFSEVQGALTKVVHSAMVGIERA